MLTFKGRHYTIYYIMDNHDQYEEKGLTFTLAIDDTQHDSHKVSVPNSVTYFTWTHVFEWWVHTIHPRYVLPR